MFAMSLSAQNHTRWYIEIRKRKKISLYTEGYKQRGDAREMFRAIPSARYLLNFSRFRNDSASLTIDIVVTCDS